MSREVHDSTPVVVGAGRYTFHRRGRPDDLKRFGMSPLQLMLEASRRALRDAGLSSEGEPLNSIAHVSAATDAQLKLIASRFGGGSRKPLGDDRFLYSNTPGVVAAGLGCPAKDIKELVITGDSGHMPQALVNRACEKIASGELESAMVIGAEALHSMVAALGSGVSPKDLAERWGDSELSTQARTSLEIMQRTVGRSSFPVGQTIEEMNRFYTDLDRKHGMTTPITAYPLMENSLRVKEGSTIEKHQAKVAELFSGFSEVAATDQDNSWFGVAYSPEDMNMESAENRKIVHPFYLKRLNSVMTTDQSAAVIIMSAGEAKRRKVPRDKWVFLHGCSEAADRYELLERPSLCESVALRVSGTRALEMAGVNDVNRDIRFFDIYSCFPVAVQVACREMGINMNQPLTLTGGLPYHGGPGSNYVTHSIAAAVERLRACGGDARALVTANGGLLTKHAMGVYANFPDDAACEGRWRREAPAAVQAEVDAYPREKVADKPQGTGVIETYCVRYGRKGPDLAIVVGKLTDGPLAGQRFTANTPKGDVDALQRFIKGDLAGARGSVSCGPDGKAVFQLFDGASKL